MKKTKVMSTIAMVCFILSLVWAVINDINYYINAFKFNYGGAIIARVFFFSTLPSIVGIILLIISAKKAKTGIKPPQYKLGFFFLAGSLLLNFIISIIVLKGDLKDSVDYTIRVLILIPAFLLVAFDAALLKPNKAMGIVGAALIIGVAVVFSAYYSYKISSDIPGRFYSDEEMFGYISNLVSFASYYTMLQFLGVGALLYAIGRQPKDVPNIPAPPSYPNGGNGGQFNNQYNYQPPQTPYQDNYQPPQTPDRNNYQPPYNGQ